MLALHREDDDEIAAALAGVGVVVDRHDPALAAKLAYGMFDTRGRQERGALERGCVGGLCDCSGAIDVNWHRAGIENADLARRASTIHLRAHTNTYIKTIHRQFS